MSISLVFMKRQTSYPFSSKSLKVCLLGSRLDQDPMPTLERLPKLRILELHAEVFMPATGFPRLEFLSIFLSKKYRGTEGKSRGHVQSPQSHDCGL